MEAGWLKRLLQAHEVEACSSGADLEPSLWLVSLSRWKIPNNALGSLAHSIWRGTTEMLISWSCRVFLLISLVFQCLMLSSTTVFPRKCRWFLANGSISLIVCYFAADYAGNRLYRKADASYLSPVAEWTSHFQSRVFANPWACLTYGRGFQYQNKSGLLFLDV